LSASFPALNGINQGDAIIQLIFNFALQYVSGKVEQNQVRLKLKETHLLLAYADEVNLLANKIKTTEKNIEPLTDVS
jgi:hypothetical protein